MILQHKKVAIVGGGPGGLTLARLLQMEGIDVKVYERDADRTARQQGATLDLHEDSGLRAIREAGLEKEFYARYRPGAGKMRVLDHNGIIHSDDHETDSGFDDLRPEIDRAPLRELLMNSLQNDTIVWDSQFVSMEKQNNGWLLYFSNGSAIHADIVIAADGANSKIRHYITDIRPVYSGITIVEGNVYHAEKNVPNLWKLLKGGKIFAFGNEQSIILSAKGDGSLSFYTGCKVPENWATQSSIDFNNKEQVFNWFKTAYNLWDNRYLELFTSDECWFVPRPQYHFPLDQHWESFADLTMIGDAAHRMPPYAGEGANMAMLDAIELANCLTSHDFPTIQSAIAHYEKHMLKRAAKITKDTLDSTQNLHAPDAIERLLNMFKNNH